MKWNTDDTDKPDFKQVKDSQKKVAEKLRAQAKVTLRIISSVLIRPIRVIRVLFDSLAIHLLNLRYFRKLHEIEIHLS